MVGRFASQLFCDGEKMRKYPTELIIQTLFGPAIPEEQCNTCLEFKTRNKFYNETPGKMSKRKRPGQQVRAQCIDCWKKYQGRTWLKKQENEYNLKNVYIID